MLYLKKITNFLTLPIRILICRIYSKLGFHGLENIIRSMPYSGSEMVSTHFRYVAKFTLLLLIPLLPLVALVGYLVRAINVYACFIYNSVSDNRDYVSDFLVTSNVEKTALVVIPDWPRCGSTVMYKSQFRSLSKAGYDVYLLVFSDHYYYSGASEKEYYQNVKLRQKEIFGMEEDSRIVVVPSVVNMTYITSLIKNNFMKSSSLRRHCTKFLNVTTHSKNFSKVLSGVGLVVVNRVTYLEYFRQFQGKVFLETHDVMSHTLDFLEKNNETYELALARDLCSGIGCYTNFDLKFYKDSGVKTLLSKPGILSDPALYIKKSSEQTINLLYVGDNHPQNLRSLSECLSYVPDEFRMRVVGRVCTGLKDMNLRENIELVGYCDSLEKEFLNTDLLVIPDFYGTGISIKALEFLSLGIPIFASSQAYRGLDIELPSTCTTELTGSAFFEALKMNLNSLAAVNWYEIKNKILEQYGTANDLKWVKEVELLCDC